MTVALLDRYVSREMGTAFVFGVAFFTVFLLANHLLFVARLIIQNGTSIASALDLLVYRLPYLVGFSFPMATLLATILSFGRMNEHQEVTALRVSGISLWRIARPALIAGLAVSLLTLAFNEKLVPASEERYQDTVRRAFAQNPPGVSGRQQNVLFRDTLDGEESLIVAQRYDRDTQTLQGIVVNQFREGRVVRVIQAERAVWTPRALEFRRGRMYVLGENGTVTTTFAVLRARSRIAPSLIPERRKRPDEMTAGELLQATRAAEALGYSRAVLRTQLQLRFALPLASLAFVLLGIPLSLRPGRSGRSISLGLAILVIVGYYLLLSVATPLGEGGRVPAAVAAWLPNVVLGLVGVWLLAQEDR